MGIGNSIASGAFIVFRTTFRKLGAFLLNRTHETRSTCKWQIQIVQVKGLGLLRALQCHHACQQLTESISEAPLCGIPLISRSNPSTCWSPLSPKSAQKCRGGCTCFTFTMARLHFGSNFKLTFPITLVSRNSRQVDYVSWEHKVGIIELRFFVP